MIYRGIKTNDANNTVMKYVRYIEKCDSRDVLLKSCLNNVSSFISVDELYQFKITISICFLWVFKLNNILYLGDLST